MEKVVDGSHQLREHNIWGRWTGSAGELIIHMPKDARLGREGEIKKHSLRSLQSGW